VQKYILFSDFQKIVVAFCFIQATKQPIICFLQKYFYEKNPISDAVLGGSPSVHKCPKHPESAVHWQ
jgi:hypothetical protein